MTSDDLDLWERLAGCLLTTLATSCLLSEPTRETALSACTGGAGGTGGISGATASSTGGTDAGGSTMIATEPFSYAIGSNLTGQTGGTGWQTSAAHPGSLCTGSDFGDTGPAWVKIPFSSNAIILSDFSPLPAGLTSLGNAASFPAATDDNGRTLRTLDTSPGSPACTLGLCDASSDLAGRPMLGAGTYFIGFVLASDRTDTTSIYGGGHLYQGAGQLGGNCGADKPNERILMGANNLQTVLGVDRTTNGAAGASKWLSTVTLNTTPHLLVYKIENAVSDTLCSTPDGSGAAVSCPAGEREAVTLWVDAMTSSDAPAVTRKVIAGWGNSRGLNTVQLGGKGEAVTVSHLCIGLTFADARCGQ